MTFYTLERLTDTKCNNPKAVIANSKLPQKKKTTKEIMIDRNENCIIKRRKENDKHLYSCSK